jgi:hypothetical protein
MSAGLTKRQVTAPLKISAARNAYLENGKRSPSAALVQRRNLNSRAKQQRKQDLWCETKG